MRPLLEMESLRSLPNIPRPKIPDLEQKILVSVSENVVQVFDWCLLVLARRNLETLTLNAGTK